jgi:hypothetical protein
MNNNGQVTALVAADRERVLMEAIRKDVEEVRSIEEANGYANVTKEMADLVAKITHSQTAANDLMEKHLWWKRRQGELLARTPLSQGGRPTENRLHDATGLAGLGIEKTDSHRSQRLATIPKEVYRQEIARLREEEEELTTRHFLKFARNLEREKKRAASVVPALDEDHDTIRLGAFQDVLPTLPADSVDLIFTDPPYDAESIPSLSRTR